MTAVAEDAAWLDDRLAAAGWVRTGPVVGARERAWSTVLTAATDRGPVWLKVPGPGSAFEPGLCALLAAVSPEHVLTPIAVDRGRVLLPDGGPTLSTLDEPSVHKGLLQALPRYAELQRNLASHVEEMLGLGVTDMRPAVMPDRFDEAVEAARRRGGEAAREVVGWRARFVGWCERLAASAVPASVDHNDLHRGSVFVAGPRFFDWGDAVVAHPFASMLVALGTVADDLAAARLRDAYLEAFTDLAPRRELLEDLETACRVAKPARALVWDRALPHDNTTDFADAPLRTLLALRNKNHLSLTD